MARMSKTTMTSKATVTERARALWSLDRLKRAIALWLPVEGVGRRRGRVALLSPSTEMAPVLMPMTKILNGILVWADRFVAEAEQHDDAEAWSLTAGHLQEIESELARVNAVVHALARRSPWATAERLEKDVRAFAFSASEAAFVRIVPPRPIAPVIPLRPGK
jgi:hypothetical protein